MTGKKSTSKPQSTLEWKGFVDVSLTDADREVLRETRIDLDETMLLLVDVINTGHKVSFSKKADKPSVVCTFTGTLDNAQNAGWALSSFAPDLLSAMRVNLYKHFTIAHGEYTSLKARAFEEFG